MRPSASPKPSDAPPKPAQWARQSRISRATRSAASTTSTTLERVQAAVEAAHSLAVPVMLTARAENLLRGRNDLDDIIRRLQAFEKAGADVLYAPGLRDLRTIRAVVGSVGKPINVVMSMADPSITAEQLADAGVKRISVGGALSRLSLGAFMEGAREMAEKGSFTWVWR